MILQYEPKHNRELLKRMMNSYFSEDGWITEHKLTLELEKKIAYTLGNQYCHMVNNGTISLSLALIAEGVKAGDKVLIPSLSMIATANAVTFIGAIPVFVDVDEYLCMSYDRFVEAIKLHNPKAVMFVSLNGRVGDGERIRTVCELLNIKFIEDAAQSFGSTTTNANIKSYSFSMPKIISMGQGGCLVTDNEKTSRTLKHLKDFGRENGGNDCHDYYGINSKITELQAIVGLEQLEDIDWRINRKKEMYRLYKKELENYTHWIPTDLEKVTPWFIEFFCCDREKLIEYLKQNKIGTRKIYPPMYSQKIYSYYLNEKENNPVTEYYTSLGFWLPSSFTLTDEDIKYVCDKIKEFYK